MEINSNKIIIIKTIVGFMIKNKNKMQFKITFIFSTKTYGLGTQKNHLNGKVLEGQPRECYGIPWRLIAIKLLLSRQ